MSRRLLSLMFACTAVVSVNSFALDYSVFPIVDSLVYNDMKSLSEATLHASMTDVMAASHHFELIEPQFEGEVIISDVAVVEATSEVVHSESE